MNKKPPNKIYLQIGDHNYDDLDHEEVTWCADRIEDTDIEYTINLPVYCTPDQYKEITGKDWPDDALVWSLTPVYKDPEEDEAGPFETVLYHYWKPVLRKENGFQNDGIIVQTAQPAPPADYRPED